MFHFTAKATLYLHCRYFLAEVYEEAFSVVLLLTSVEPWRRPMEELSEMNNTIIVSRRPAIVKRFMRGIHGVYAMQKKSYFYFYF